MSVHVFRIPAPVIPVELTPEELDEAVRFGARRERSMEERHSPRAKAVAAAHRDRAKQNRQGAAAEFGAAKHYGLLGQWRGEQAYSDDPDSITCDLGRNCHVKSTTYETGKLLIPFYDVRPDNPRIKPDQPVILVHVDGDAFRFVTLVGWVYARESVGRERCPFCRSADPSWMTRQENLRAMSTLPLQELYDERHPEAPVAAFGPSRAE